MSRVIIESAPTDRALVAHVEMRLSEKQRTDVSTAVPTGETVLVVMPGSGTFEAQRSQRTILAAAAAIGARHVVDVSFLGTPSRLAPEVAAAAGLTWTGIRSTLHEQAVLDLVGEDGVIRVPASDWPIAVVAQRDVAEVIAAVAADPSAFRDRELVLTGPTAYGFADIAEMLTAATGTWSAYYPQTPSDAYLSRRRSGMSASRMATELSMFDAIRDGAMSKPTGDLSVIVGHEATELWEVLQLEALLQAA